MLNKVAFNGRLTDDPELRYSPSGTAVCSFTIAVQRSRKNKEGEYETDFPDCVTFKKRAEWIAQNVQKGELVGIGGRIQTRLYESDGYTNKSTEVIVDDFQKIEWHTSNESDNTNTADKTTGDEDDIEVPF